MSGVGGKKVTDLNDFHQLWTNRDIVPSGASALSGLVPV